MERSRRRWTLCGAGLCCTAAASLSAQAVAQSSAPDLATVLARVSAYVEEFDRQLAGIVIEEDYQQRLLPDAMRTRRSFNVSGRRLRSDLLMVRLEGEDRWVQFRDVFEVDGRAVRDRDQRLARLFLAPSASSLDQAEAIALESARYNLGRVYRTINVPVLAMSYFNPRHRHRSTFSRVEPGNTKALSGVASVQDIWAIRFEESQPNTLIRTEGDADLPASGRVWIDVSTGRILKTELIVEAARVRARIEVSYRHEPGVDVLVPSEMREEYDAGPGTTRIWGRASYGTVKRFTVTTETTLRKPPGRQ
jgi:hypothetical protein